MFSRVRSIVIHRSAPLDLQKNVIGAEFIAPWGIIIWTGARSTDVALVSRWRLGNTSEPGTSCHFSPPPKFLMFLHRHLNPNLNVQLPTQRVHHDAAAICYFYQPLQQLSICSLRTNMQLHCRKASG